ncbi:MAG: hypothetical protein LC739_05190 [Actinobacteria bacterium]|nr:hypothetical protein [Actinomycetota bacterium]
MNFAKHRIVEGTGCITAPVDGYTNLGTIRPAREVAIWDDLALQSHVGEDFVPKVDS